MPARTCWLLAEKDKDEGRASPTVQGAFRAGRGSPTAGPKPAARGFRIAQWDAQTASSSTIPGHDVDMMYLNVPLRGDFQLDCELSSTLGRKMRVIYGGMGLAPGE